MDRVLPGPLDSGPVHDDPLLGRLHARSGPERYAIDEAVGRGGMGTVYRVRDVDLDRTLAVKVATDPSGLGSAAPPVDRARTTRFLEEAQITGQLDHPGIVPVHELGVDPRGRPFFSMKLVDGESLDEVLRARRGGGSGWSRARLLEALVRVCEAVGYAHDRGVVHRDLKPANIMLGRRGEAFVMDWGLARARGLSTPPSLRMRAVDADDPVLTRRADRRPEESVSSLVTEDGTVLGTPYYMPPEQAAGRIDEVDARSDVYAMGAILYEVLTGRRPFEEPGEVPDARVVLARVLTDAPADVRDLAPDAPAELVAICERAMHRDAAERYADMRALAGDLRAFQERKVVEAHRTGARAELLKWIQRNPALASLLAGVALAFPVLGAMAPGLMERSRGVREARALEEADWLEAQLARGFALLGQRDLRAADAAFALARERSPDSREALGGQCLARVHSGDPDGALALLSEVADPSSGLVRLRAMALDGAGRPSEADALLVDAPPLRGALDEFLAGHAELVPWSEVHQEGAGVPSAERALAHYRAAVLDARDARLMYHLAWAESARLAADREACLLASEALTALWPSDRVALVEAGACAQALGEHEQALQLFGKARAIAESPDALAGEASALLSLGRREEADALHDELASSFPRNAIAQQAIARARMRVGDYASARDACEAAIELGVDTFEMRSSLGQAQLWLGAPRSAVPHLARAVELLERGRDAGQASRWRHGLVQHHYSVALYQAGEWASAIEAAEQAVELMDLSPRLTLVGALAAERLEAEPAAGSGAESELEAEARALLEQAERELFVERFAAAISAVEALIDQHGASFEAYRLLGMAFFETADRARALECWEAALALRPDADVEHWRAKALASIGREREAVAAYRALFEAQPSNARINRELCALLLGMGRTLSQLRQLEAFRDANPDSISAHVELAQAQYVSGRFEGALETLRSAGDLVQGQAATDMLEGLLLFQLGRYAEALPELESALALGANDPKYTGRWTAEQLIRASERALRALERRER